MKRWFSKDSVQLKVGIAALLLIVGLGVAVAVHRPALHNNVVQPSNVVAAAVTPKAESLTQQPKAPVLETKVETTEQDVPFSTTETYDGTLPKGTEVVRVDGVDGKEIVKTEVKLKDGVEISRELISEDLTVPPVAKVLAIGTRVVATKPNPSDKSCDTHYSPCVKVTGGDINCAAIGHQVRVVTPGVDPYHLDRNNDGIGCESYPTVDDNQSSSN